MLIISTFLYFSFLNVYVLRYIKVFFKSVRLLVCAILLKSWETSLAERTQTNILGLSLGLQNYLSLCGYISISCCDLFIY